MCCSLIPFDFWATILPLKNPPTSKYFLYLFVLSIAALLVAHIQLTFISCYLYLLEHLIYEFLEFFSVVFKFHSWAVLLSYFTFLAKNPLCQLTHASFVLITQRINFLISGFLDSRQLSPDLKWAMIQRFKGARICRSCSIHERVRD